MYIYKSKKLFIIVILCLSSNALWGGVKRDSDGELVRSNGSRQAADETAARILVGVSSKARAVPAALEVEKCLAEPVAKRPCSDVGSVSKPLDTVNKYHCGINGCAHRVTSPAGIRQHQLMCHPAGNLAQQLNISCKSVGCGFKARKTRALKQHVDTCHTTEGVYSCLKPQCDFSTLNECDLDTHPCKNQGAKAEKCGVGGCKVRYVQLLSLYDHKKEIHGMHN